MFENQQQDMVNLNPDEPYPFVKEVKYTGDIRKIQIKTSKAFLIGMIILVSIQVIFIIIGLTAFANNKPLKILFCTIQLPYILMFLLIPANATCIYDYTTKTFTSYVSPIIPIPFGCFSTKINFNEIAGFFLHKLKHGTKKYYKVGVKREDGRILVIAIGQDTKCQTDFDKNLDYIPYLLRTFLKPGEQHLV